MSCWNRERAPLVARVAPGLCSPGPDGPGIGEVEVVDTATRTPCLVDRIDCDAETASIRALGQYLAMLEIDHLGRRVAFETVTEGWPESLDVSRLPAAGITSVGAGAYDIQTPSHIRIAGAPEGLVFHKMADWEGQLRIQVIATSREERVALRMMIERALFPHDFCGGLRLVVPFYAAMHLEFVMLSAGFEESPDGPAQQLWGMVINVKVAAPVFRVARLPVAKLITRGSVTTSQDAASEDRAFHPLPIR